MERNLLAGAEAFVYEEDATGRPPLPPPARTACAARLARLVLALPRDRRRLLILGCRVLDLLALLRHGRTFSRLGAPRALRLLDSLGTSRLALLRRLGAVLRMLTQFAYFADPLTWEAAGYDGPWLGRVPVEVLPAPRLELEDGRP